MPRSRHHSFLVSIKFLTFIKKTNKRFLGDIRFARRVREILGEPVLMSPSNINSYDNYEPVPARVRVRLRVAHNKDIPLMLHMKAITIPKYKGNDLYIESKTLPHYFDWALKRLDLQVPDGPEQELIVDEIE